MAKQLSKVDTSIDTFNSWVVKVNDLIDFANSEVVTANNSANGAITTGKGFVIGTFGSNTVVCSTLSGGNTISSGSITISSNTTFTDQLVKVNNGVVRGANSIAFDSTTRITTSTTASNQVVDTFAIATYRSAKYVISVTDPVNSAYQATEIMLLHDGANTYSTEYATLLSNTSLATFSSDISSGNVRLLVTPAVSNVQINVTKTLVSI
jgi:hypothetical protein